MVYTLDNYLDSLKSDNNNVKQIDEPTKLGMFAAIASAGNTYHQMEQHGTAAKLDYAGLKNLAHDAILKEDLFLSQAGTRPLVDKYADELIARSQQLDEKDRAKGKNVPDGTHLREFLHETGNAVNHKGRASYDEIHHLASDYLINHDLAAGFKLQKLKSTDLLAIENDVHKAAVDNIDNKLSPKKLDPKSKEPDVTIDQDYIRTIQEPDPVALQQDPNTKKRKFDDVKLDEPAPHEKGANGMDFFGKLIEILMKLLGGGGDNPGQGIGDMFKDGGLDLSSFLGTAPKAPEVTSYKAAPGTTTGYIEPEVPTVSGGAPLGTGIQGR